MLRDDQAEDMFAKMLAQSGEREIVNGFKYQFKLKKKQIDLKTI